MSTGGLPPQAHSNALSALEGCVDAMVGTSFDHHTVGEQVDIACRLQRLSARLDSVRARVLADANSAAKQHPGVLRDLGFRTPAQAVAAETGASAPEIRAVARAGAWLADFPIFFKGLASGVLSLPHIRELKRLDKPRTHDELVLAQDELLAAARNHDFVEFTHRMATWAINHDPDGDDVKEQVESTSCSMTKHTDGSITGRFRLDPLSAAAVGSALENEVQRLFNQQSADDGPVERADRRRGQALVGLIVGGAEAPGSATTAPLVNLVLGQLVAENLLERLVSLPKANSSLPGNARQYADPAVEPVDIDRDDPDRRCELIDGTPIHPDLAMVALAAARFRRIVLDARSKPIDVSYTSRGFPPEVKQVLLVLARGRCETRGCDASHRWLEADHVHPHSKGGRTSLANGQVLCGADNKWKNDHVDTAV
jgi:hypothetical protein